MIRVGPLLISSHRRGIRSRGEFFRISSQTFHILELLIQANGATLSGKEMMGHVWPDSVVKRNNVDVHFAALRKALAGDRDLIRTIPARDYRLIAPGSAVATSAWAMAGSGPSLTHLARMRSAIVFGREGSISDIVDAVSTAKTVTLVGSGGTGKTRVAMEVAARVEDLLCHGVIFRRSHAVQCAVPAKLQSELGNLRAALHWAFSPDANRRLAADLAAVAVPDRFDESLIDGCSERAQLHSKRCWIQMRG
ncbi:winged helix-turn-helix domain-containing protein [Paraburkholderia strydomiana]|uniref:winged helix-turn-helix domain-containing protein n=1 Tax=Paraburkholderia strydomiana TaxID=1245417 RepID=UPI002864B999|nr:winged helix-turn-helix domain-containing protein [Paraburkholderia strydomiana]MDR7010058.1 DNA-binding winged helix-turn-helix (wHTH) protein [Paraburkholderia strydomiana]